MVFYKISAAEMDLKMDLTELEYFVTVFNILKNRMSHPAASILSQKMWYLCIFFMYTTDLYFFFNGRSSDLFQGYKMSTQLLWHPMITYPHYLKKKIEQKLKFGTPYFCYPTKNFNLLAMVEDIIPGQWHFHTIIFTYQNHFSVPKKFKFGTL